MKTEVKLLQEFEASVRSLPDVYINSASREALLAGRRYDLLVTAEFKGQPARLVVEAKSNGYPRDIQAALSQLGHVREEPSPIPLIPVVIAPAITQSSRTLLRSNKVGFWDTGGSLYLETPNAYFWIDRPLPAGKARKLTNVFRGNATQVLHAMLLQPERAWHVHDLALTAQVAPSTAHKVLSSLEEQLWVEKSGSGPETKRTLREPGSLLDAWADFAFYSKPMNPTDIIAGHAGQKTSTIK